MAVCKWSPPPRVSVIPPTSIPHLRNTNVSSSIQARMHRCGPPKNRSAFPSVGMKRRENHWKYFHEIFAVLGFYALWIGSPIPAFRDNLSAPFQSWTVGPFKMGPDRLFRNVGRWPSVYIAYSPRRAKLQYTPQRKTKIAHFREIR